MYSLRHDRKQISACKFRLIALSIIAYFFTLLVKSWERSILRSLCTVTQKHQPLIPVDRCGIRCQFLHVACEFCYKDGTM